MRKSPSRPDRGRDQLQNLTTCSFYHPRPLYEISLQSGRNILSNVSNKQIDRQTNTTENITPWRWLEILCVYINVLNLIVVHQDNFQKIPLEV